MRLCHGFLAGGVRHDPQRFMGKTVTVPHFNRDTVEFSQGQPTRIFCSKPLKHSIIKRILVFKR